MVTKQCCSNCIRYKGHKFRKDCTLGLKGSKLSYSKNECKAYKEKPDRW